MQAANISATFAKERDDAAAAAAARARARAQSANGSETRRTSDLDGNAVRRAVFSAKLAQALKQACAYPPTFPRLKPCHGFIMFCYTHCKNRKCGSPANPAIAKLHACSAAPNCYLAFDAPTV